MKKIFCSVMCLLALAGGASAQSKLDAVTAQYVGLVRDASAASRSGDYNPIPVAVSESDFYIVTFTDAAAAEAFEADGIIDVRANMVLVSLTAEQVFELAGDESVTGISLGSENKPYLAVARVATGVDAVQTGEGLDRAFTGKGVVIGMMDTGVDINHIAFQDADGNPRSDRMWYITGNNSSVQTFSSTEAIKKATVDTSSGTHGTHVLGIMSGSYTGKGYQAYINDRTGALATTRTKDLPYQGVAPDALLAPAAGTLHNNNSSVAASLIANYAKEKGMPAVMNLSLGHNTGPHDGTSAANRHLAEVGKEMIICISAGNEGYDAVSYHKDFTSGSTSVSTCASTTPSISSGAIDIWGSDDTPFTVTFLGVDKNTGEVKYSYKIDKSLTLTGSYYNAGGYLHDAELDKVFGNRAVVMATIGVNADNKRYNAYVTLQSAAASGNTSIVPALRVDGAAGKSVDLYIAGDAALTSNNLAGYVSGNASQSINDLACGDNVIAVGAYVNRTMYPALNGLYEFRGAGDVGAIAPFSSYGKTFQGKQLPHIAGPGMGMISSYSYYYLQNNPDEAKAATASVDHGGRTSYWAEMSGTSMSSPFVAGVMALWLEADPSLTVAEAKEIMKETAIKDEYTAAAPERFGYGKIDALAGIKRILGQGAVTDVAVGNDMMISEVARGTFDIYAPGAATVKAQLYGLNGSLAAGAEASGDSVTLSADGLTAGVYILRANDGARTLTRKVVVR